MSTDGQDRLSELFEVERGRLFAIAYRMLGSVGEAEDVVQEAFARYAKFDRSEVETPQAYLTTIATRLAIDRLRSAQRRRETYVGPWLPEPLLAAPDSAAETAELSESVSLAFLVLLESLNPVERAVFLLHEAFDYSYREIGEIVGRSADNCRQIALRARGQIEARRPRFEASDARRRELADRFFHACHEGDLEGLMQLLAEDVVMYGDGGGKAPAIRRPLSGTRRVATTLIAFAGVAGQIDVDFEPVLVNGQPGGRYLTGDGKLINVVALDIEGDGIRGIRSILNPDKLAHLGDVADATALLRQARSDSP